MEAKGGRVDRVHGHIVDSLRRCAAGRALSCRLGAVAGVSLWRCPQMSLWICPRCETIQSFRVPLVCPECGTMLSLATVSEPGEEE